MRKMKFFASLVVILVFCMVMTACAGENKLGQDSQPDTVEDHESEEQNIDDQINPDEHDPFADRDDQGNPIEHAAENEVQDGRFAYKVGDTTIYTEHDLEQWLIDDPELAGRVDFDIGTMLIDLWCQDNRGGIFENSVGYSYVLDGNNTKGVWFDSPDPESSKFFHSFTVWYKVNENEYSTTVRMYERSEGMSDLILPNYTHGIDRDMSVLLLYTIEQMEANPCSGALNNLDLGRNFYCD